MLKASAKKINPKVFEVCRQIREKMNKCQKDPRTPRVNGHASKHDTSFAELAIKHIRLSNYKSLEDNIDTMRSVVPFDKPGKNLAFDQRKKDKHDFHASCHKAKSYQPLAQLYACHEAMGTRNFDAFVKFLFTKKEAYKWIRAYIVVRAVKYRVLVEETIEAKAVESAQKSVSESKYPLLGVFNDCAFDAVFARLTQRQYDSDWLKIFQAFLVMYLSKIFTHDRQLSVDIGKLDTWRF